MPVPANAAIEGDTGLPCANRATLGNLSGAAVADGSAIGTISNDDAAAVGANKKRRPLRAAASSD